GRGRLLRQMITEGIVLSSIGGALGLAIAPVAIKVLAQLVPATLPLTAEPTLDARLLGFGLALSLVTGLLFSMIPAWQAARAGLNNNLKQDGRGGLNAHGQATRDALVVLEVALALVLLIGAGLMLQTMARLRSINLGFRSDHLLLARTIL